jgi:heat shock protein HslJ
MRATALLILAILLASCARLGLGGAGSPTPGAVDLMGTWVLDNGTSPSGAIAVPGGSLVTIRFDDSGVHGQACNIYGGSYQLSGDDINFSEMSMTEMGCDEPMMTVEARYHQALAAVTTVARSGDRLTFSGPDAELVFSLQPQVQDAGLENTYWILDTLVQGETASSVRGTAWLQLRGGELTGETGCRALTGSYVLDADRLVISRLAPTGSCPADFATQDAVVTAVLGSSPTVWIEGLALTLTGPDGAALGYSAPGED